MSYEQLMKVSGSKIDRSTFTKALNEVSFTFMAFISEWFDINFKDEMGKFKKYYETEASVLGIAL